MLPGHPADNIKMWNQRQIGSESVWDADLRRFAPSGRSVYALHTLLIALIWALVILLSEILGESYLLAIPLVLLFATVGRQSTADRFALEGWPIKFVTPYLVGIISLSIVIAWWSGASARYTPVVFAALQLSTLLVRSKARSSSIA